MPEIRAVSINLGAKAGVDDLLVWSRIVPDGREGQSVFARSASPFSSNEDLEPVSVDPDQGESLHFRPGAITLHFDEIVARTIPDAVGYSKTANNVWTWLVLGKSMPNELFYMLLAFCRRLDATHELWHEVVTRMSSLPDGFVKQREHTLQAFALAEMMVVALGRSVDMAEKIRSEFHPVTPIPSGVSAMSKPVRELRNAFEHIEDRAMGRVRKELDPDAFSVFQQAEFLEKGNLCYGNYRLGLKSDMPGLLTDLRKHGLDLVKEFAGDTYTIQEPVSFFVK